MGWIEKAASSPFDEMPIQGLSYLDGDILGRLLIAKYADLTHALIVDPNWLSGLKLPGVVFPSGEHCDIWETSSSELGCIVHIYGEMDLPYRTTRDEAWDLANEIAEMVGYIARKRGDNQLEVIGHDDSEHFLLTYDNRENRIANIEQIKQREQAQPPIAREPLLDHESRTRLPKLYSNEKLGLDAVAQVKFFSPNSGWTWYATEASAAMKDGTYKPLSKVDANDPDIEDIIFFGLVSGFELELGYFSLNELEQVGGGLQLPIERDKYFKPTALRELQEQYRKDSR